MQWENVYVFISSTFNDMHAERDYLVKKVFPQLSVWCAARKLRLVDIDLRWGVSETDATENRRVVQVCLDRIDECRPFFLCFLGQRRGWVPHKNDIGGETYQIYKKLEEAGYAGNASVTEMEILHALVDPLHGGRLARADGTLRELPAVEHAFFYLREPDYLDSITDSHLKDIYTNAAEANPATTDAELARWRETVIPGTSRPVTRYSAQWDATQRTDEIAWPTALPTTASQGSRRWQSAQDKWARQWQGAGVTVNIDGTITGQELEKARAFNEKLTRGRLGNFLADGVELADLIISQMQQAITARFGARELPAETPLQKELDQQAQFLHIASEGFIERTGDFDALNAYLAGPDRRPMAITAPMGAGKTSLLAHFIDTRRPDAAETLHYRFVGASDQSADVDGLLRSLLSELRECGKIKSDLPVTAIELRAKFYTLLENAGKTGKTIIVIDGLNQLESGMDDLAWIPARLPENLKLVVSFKHGDPAADAYYEEISVTGSVLLHEVQPMREVEDRRRLVKAYLSGYFKELDDVHEDMLIRSQGADNPLFLKIVLSELRQFGSHQSLTAYIRDNFGATPVTAFDAVLRRMETDPPYAAVSPDLLVPHIFGWLTHAQQGLSAEELAALLVRSALLGDISEAREAVAVVLRQLRPYLAHRDNRTDFFYESLRIAAQQRYTGEHPCARPVAAWHSELADYFERQSFSDAHTLMELAYQYAHAGRGNDLTRTLTDFRYLYARILTHGVEVLTADFDLASLSHINLTAEDARILKLLQEFFILSTNVLSLNPAQLTEQLYGRLLDSPLPPIQSILKQAREINRKEKQMWLRPAFRYMEPPGGRLRRIWTPNQSSQTTPITGDGSRMVIKVDWNRFNLVDLDTGKILKEFPLYTSGLAPHNVVSADGSMLFTSILKNHGNSWSLNCIEVTDLHTCTLFRRIPVENVPNIMGLSVSSDGTRVFISSREGDLIAYEKQDYVYVEILRAKSDLRPACIYLSHDGSIALVGGHSEDKQERYTAKYAVEIWDIDAGARVGELNLQGYGLCSMALAADNDTLLIGRNSRVEFWSLKERRQIRMESSKGNVYVDITPDGRLAACSDNTSVRVLHLPGLETAVRLDGHMAFVYSVAISADGSRVVSRSNDGSVRLWEAGERVPDMDETLSAPVPDSFDQEYSFRQMPAELTNSFIRASADGRRIAIAPLFKPIITMYDTHLGVRVSELEHLDRNDLRDIVVSAHGKYVAALYKNRLRCFRAQPGETIFTTDELTWDPFCFVVLEEKRQVLVGDERGVVHVFDMDSGQETYSWQAHAFIVHSMEVSSAGDLLATSVARQDRFGNPAPAAAVTDAKLKIWNTADFSSHGCAVDHTRFLAFSPDGRQYATSTNSGLSTLIILWDTKTSNPQAVMRGHRDSLIDFAMYSPNGGWLVVGRGSGKLLSLYDTMAGKLAFRLYNSGVDYKQVWFTERGDLAALCRDGMIHYFRLENTANAVPPTQDVPTAAELKFEADLFRDAGL